MNILAWLRKRQKSDLLNPPMKIGGHLLYDFKSLDHTPQFRKQYMLGAFAQWDLGVTWEDAKKATELIIEACNKNDLAGAAAMATTLDQQLDNFCSERILLEMAGPLIIVDDEPLMKMTEEHNALKRDLLQKYPSVRDFFLSTGIGLLSQFMKNIDTSKVKDSLSLPEREKRELIFLASIGVGRFDGLWRTSLAKRSGSQN